MIQEIKNKTRRLFRFTIYMLLPIGGGWLGGSCSDFADYNEIPADASSSASQTLWENISQTPQLSGFASLVKRTGFDTELANSRAYTVWAPLDGTYPLATYQALDDSTLLQQFVKGHVAQYGHVASGQVSERVHMLNAKSFAFEGNGTYTFGGVNLSQANMPSTNGTMHLLNGAAPFFYNLYEYIMANKQDTLLRDFFKKYELTTLDTKNSVKGPVVNGLQTYIDSVLTTSNSLLRTLNASLSNEDSTYTFLLPNDKAYQDMYNKVLPHFNYVNSTEVFDVDKFKSASSTDKKTITVNAKYLSDSLTCRTILRNLAFSNNDEYNKWMVDRGERTDTMRSTTRTKFSNPDEILSHTVNKVTMSNGYAHILDTVAFYPWETYLPQLDISMGYTYTENSRSRFNFATRVASFEDPLGKVLGPEVTSFRYLWIYPTGDYVKPEVFVALPNVMSATYNIYCVFLPAKVMNYYGEGDSLLLSSDERPNILNFQLNYTEANGKAATHNFSKKYLESGKSSDYNPKSVSEETAFTNDPLKTDIIFIGQFTFPVSYYGLEDYNPTLHISCPIGVFNKEKMSTYTRDIRIAAIILEPIQLTQFRTEHNQ